jgi:3-hydroxyisobutyrate dehydrogenase-like beta-hydroxyacid dehydrogenase
MATESTIVAAIGLGRMGGAIARNICSAGFEVRVFNRTRAKAEPFAALGATVAASPAEASRDADVVITNLLDDVSVLDCLTREDGLLAGMKPGAVHVGTTTVSPGLATEAARLHAEAGSRYVAGPIVGRPPQAKTGELMTVVAGEADAIEAARPVLEAYTSSIMSVGEAHATANSIKLAINYFSISLVELMGELYAFAEKSGIGVDRMRDLVQWLLKHPAFVSYSENIAARRFEPAGFSLRAGHKDVQLMLQAAVDVRAPLKYGSLIRDKLITALARGMDELDWSSIYEITRAEAGLE